MPDALVWEDIRRAYEDITIPIKDLLTRFAISRHRLQNAVKQENWPRRPGLIARQTARAAARASSGDAPSETVAPPLPMSPPADPTPSPTRSKSTSIAHRRALVRRIYAAIDTKLKLLERRFEREMASLDGDIGDGVSSADTERDTRAIGTLIKSLEQVTEYDHGQQSGKPIHGAAAKSARLAATELADEADRVRRELADRLQRFIDAAKTGP